MIMEPLGRHNRPISIDEPVPKWRKRVAHFNESYTIVHTIKAPQSIKVELAVYTQSLYLIESRRKNGHYVIKVIESDGEYETHELDGWNRIRYARLPGFIATHGYLKWIGDEDDEPVYTITLLMEYVSNTLANHDTLRLGQDDYISLIAEMLAILGVARERLQFIHNDVHEGNIAIKQMPQDYVRRYSFGGHSFQFDNIFMPQLFDLEKCHFGMPLPPRASSDIVNVTTVFSNVLSAEQEQAYGLTAVFESIRAQYPRHRGDGGDNVRGIVRILRQYTLFTPFWAPQGVGEKVEK